MDFCRNLRGPKISFSDVPEIYIKSQLFNLKPTAGWSKTFNFGNWANALDPMLPGDETTQTETSILPNRCHLIKIKQARLLTRKTTGPGPLHLSTLYPL